MQNKKYAARKRIRSVTQAVLKTVVRKGLGVQLAPLPLHVEDSSIGKALACGANGCQFKSDSSTYEPAERPVFSYIVIFCQIVILCQIA